MKKMYLLLPISIFLLCFQASAQAPASDSALVARTLHELLRICRSVNFADPKVTQLGTFYQAAPYIVYRGDDKKRAWKTISDYTNDYEKRGVNDICERINRTANRDSSGYKITRYITEKESEGTWHVLTVTYKINNAVKTAHYAFLKIGKNFALGDID